MKKTLLLLFGSILFFSFDCFSQCENIVVTFPNGQCTAFARVRAHTNISQGGYFTLKEFVNGDWQDVMTLPNDAPPVQFDFNLTQTSEYVVDYAYDGVCTSTSSSFTLTLPPPTPYVPGVHHICSGESKTFTVGNPSGANYRWYEGTALVADGPGTQFSTGPLTSSKTYYVAAVSEGGCESDKITMVVTVHNPSPPTPFNTTRCRPETNVTLSVSGSFSAYQWYDQNNAVLGTTATNSLVLSNPALTSYKLKVQDSWGCWSTNVSAAATVTTTHGQGPAVWQQSSCTSVTMTASYTGDGSYQVEWYTAATGGTPEYSDVIPHAESQVSYSPNLSSPKTYWVEVYDFTSDCRTPRTQITVTPPTARYVWGSGQSCESGMVSIQAQGSNVSTYSLYYFDGQNYNFISQNSTGTFVYDNFESDDLNYTSRYYLKGSGGGCQTTGYTQVTIQVLRPAMPTVTGNVNLCYNTGTILTASGGTEGSYRWYQNSDPNPVSGQNGSQFSTGNLTASTVYEVSYIVQGVNGQCESPKRLMNVGITPSSSVTGFSVSPGTEFYGTVSPPLTLSHVSHVGQLIYESSTNGTNWSATMSNPTVDQPITYFHAKAVSGDCPPAYSSPIIVSLYPLPVIAIDEEVNYLTYGNALHLTTGTYYSYQWIKEGQDIAGANQQTFMVTEPGAYTLRVKGSAASPQVASEGVTIYSDAVKSQNLNYVSTVTPLEEGIDPSALHTLRPDQYSRSTTYFDGLGRPMQTVVAKGSPQAKDVIQPIVYDEFGREKRKYLPFVNPDRNAGLYTDNGLIIGAGYDYIGNAASFYDSPETKVADDGGDRPYAETVFEPSPLNRPVKEYGVGGAWGPNASNKYVEHRYPVFDHAQESIIVWKINADGTLVQAEAVADLIEAGGYYSKGQLRVKSTLDEHGNEIREYTDRSGRMILKKIQIVGNAQLDNGSHWAQTYYIYDDLGNLAVVLPPEAVKKMEAVINEN